MIFYDYLFVGGLRAEPSTKDAIDVFSPHSGALIAQVPAATSSDMDMAIHAAKSAMISPVWGGLCVADRLAVISRFADECERRAPDFARAMTQEMGCAASQVRMLHIDPALRVLRYYLKLAEDYPFEELRVGERSTIVLRRPVGVVAAVIPWNGPVMLAMMKLSPAFVSGCAVVLKVAPEAPLSSYVLAEAAEAAGLPPGVLNILPANREASEYLVSHPDIRKVSFTGSSSVGRRIAQLCGDDLKRFNLELGGKSAAIVLDDADPGMVANALRLGSFANSGQVCTARTRILAHRDRYDAVVAAIADMASSLNVGDPDDPATQVGPLVSKRQQENVLRCIAQAKEDGARLVAGGGIPPGLEAGCYVQPTVFADVMPDMRIARDEVFGPVVCVMRYDDDDDAVRIANDSIYGLSGSVFTTNIERGMQIARRIDSGTFGINTFGNDICAPMGGVKLSGVGREMGPEGLEEFLEYRSILLPADYENGASLIAPHNTSMTEI